MSKYISEDKYSLGDAIDWYVNASYQYYGGFDQLEEVRKLDHPVRRSLIEARLSSFLVRDDGSEVQIPPQMWNRMQLWENAFSKSLERLSIADEIVVGYLAVSRKDFWQEFRDHIKIPEDCIVPAELIQSSSNTLKNGHYAGYVPPILLYLLDVAYRFDLNPDYRFDKKILSDWIESNPPRNDQKIMPSAARAYARVLGAPKFSGGGNFRVIPGGRPLNPLTAYNGIQYPKPSRLEPSRQDCDT